MAHGYDLERLVADLSPAQPAAPGDLKDAELALGFDFPADYISLMRERDGGEGKIGSWWVQLWRAEDLVRLNVAYRSGRTEENDIVLFGGNGADETLVFERTSGAVWLVPLTGERTDWIRLGSTITEAFRRLERGDVFENNP